MKSNIDESLHLFKALVILLTMNCTWVAMTTVIHGAVSLEGIFSSHRLLLSVLLAYAIHRHVSLHGIGYGLFWVSVTNSALVTVQLFDSLHDQAYLPPWLQYGWFYGVENLEFWRKGGLVPSLQTSSLFAVYGIFFGTWRCSRNVMFVSLPFLAVAVLVGARTFAPIALVGIAYSLFRMPVVSAAWLAFLAWYLPSLDGFWGFFELRFGGLLDVFFSFDFASDYSAVDTVQSYREFSIVEFFVGNGEERYSDAGGQDPFYTRWFYQSGLPSVLLLLAMQAVIGGKCGRYSTIAYLVLAMALYHNIKGELFTSTGTFDILVLVAFVFLRERGRRVASLDACPTGASSLQPLQHVVPITVRQ